MNDIASVQAISPWHEGELAIQKQVGIVDKMAGVGMRNIRHYLTQQHREFYPLLPFIVMGTVDPQGEAWATLLAGHPGFLSSPDNLTLQVESRLDPMDPAAPGSQDGNSVGLLGMQLETRRPQPVERNDLSKPADRFDVAVEDSFGNCDRYITIRQHSFAREPEASFSSARRRRGSSRRERTADDPERRHAVSWPLMSIATMAEDRSMFLTAVAKRASSMSTANGDLSIPDFKRQRLFQYPGNILKNPQCGLLFVDFETGDMLQIAGEGSVVLEGPEVAAFQGAERLWRFHPRHVVYRKGAFPVRFCIG